MSGGLHNQTPGSAPTHAGAALPIRPRASGARAGGDGPRDHQFHEARGLPPAALGLSVSHARQARGGGVMFPPRRRLPVEFQVRAAERAVTVGEPQQAAKTFSVLPHVSPKLPGLASMHDRLLNVLHVDVLQLRRRDQS